MQLKIGLVVLALGVPTIALANGLGENRSWQFKTASERNVDLNLLDTRELKAGGFYDQYSGSGGSGNGLGGTTNVFGDQYNCIVTSTASGNDAPSTNMGETGTFDGVRDGTVKATSAGNDGTASSTGGGTVGNDQMAHGNQTSGTDDSNVFTEIGSFTGGDGTTDQSINTDQVVGDNSPVSSSVDTSTACDGILN